MKGMTVPPADFRILSRFKRHVALVFVALCLGHAAFAEDAALTLSDTAVRLTWEKSAAGWALHEVVALDAQTNSSRALGHPSGRYTVLFSPTAPDDKAVGPPLSQFYDLAAERRQGDARMWARVTDGVSLNTAGRAIEFLPAKGVQSADGALAFEHEDENASVRADWSLDPHFPGDVRVTLTLTAKRRGYYSIATPSVVTVPGEDLQWATVPGYFQGSTIENNLFLAYGYGQGLPAKPVVLRERTATTLASLMTHRSGVTLGVTAEPGTAADPWAKDADTRALWKLGLSHMNRDGELSPTLYHPVLGQEGSLLVPAEVRTFRFRYTVRAGDWFSVNEHIVQDIYRFPETLALREPQRSLADRLHALHRYVTDARTSLWRVEDFQNLRIGAQTYMAPVEGAGGLGDSIKNSDYGAMWMLARLTGDPVLLRDRLPFARNFKLVQVQKEDGFFQGAVVGQYYLPSRKRFTEEWGDYVEPVALTYYALIDLGNILLFAPEDAEIRNRFRLSAERLLAWQHADGHWEVGYNRKSLKPVFTDLRDYRPTFYGLLVAYQMLGDEKYLAAAQRGADWLVENAVKAGRFLGVCGDSRFVPDFATGQISQALLDLHAVTGNARYRDAGIATAHAYVTSIYTHPIATNEPRIVGGLSRHEWQINQAGLSFEHGGLLGSATTRGPILLASHAGLFLRVYQLTGEAIFRDMARSAAVARDAFVEPATGVASYYWKGMNAGAGPFPHHAWWQIGWITDYLMSEIALRSRNAVAFPRGFFAPKVGPHSSYGFKPGTIFGEAAELAWSEVSVDNPAVDYIVARATKGARVFLLLLNEVGRENNVTIVPDARTLTGGAAARWSSIRILGTGNAAALDATAPLKLTIPGYGLTVIALDFDGR
jgi:hypothetical protein